MLLPDPYRHMLAIFENQLPFTSTSFRSFILCHHAVRPYIVWDTDGIIKQLLLSIINCVNRYCFAPFPFAFPEFSSVMSHCNKCDQKKKKWPVRGLPWEFYTTLETAGVNRKWNLVWLQLSTQSVAPCFLPSDFLTRWVTAARMFPRVRSEIWALLIQLTKWVKYAFSQFNVALLYCLCYTKVRSITSEMYV